MEPEASKNRPTSKKRRLRLRSGFSTGTAATAAARGALRRLLTGRGPDVVAVRLPVGYYLPIDIHEHQLIGEGAWASVIKDAGDDPDVTHGAELRAIVRCFSADGRQSMEEPSLIADTAGATSSDSIVPGSGAVMHSAICLIGGDGVGVVTKAGLPVAIGEPAINPGPREMLSENLVEELLWSPSGMAFTASLQHKWIPPDKPHVLLPFPPRGLGLKEVILSVEIQVLHGEKLAQRTLNPRLGIMGGISILGTTGIVKPFSHEAYEETIHTALSVAAANGCKEVALSTGGKSEHFAKNILQGWSEEAFVQIADFFAYSVSEALRMGFEGIVHSTFFGKVLKMAAGHAYTHAHKVSLDLRPLADLAGERGYDRIFCTELASANTARHALELLLTRGAKDVIEGAAQKALEQSAHLSKGSIPMRLLLFNYDGKLLADLRK